MTAVSAASVTGSQGGQLAGGVEQLVGEPCCLERRDVPRVEQPGRSSPLEGGEVRSSAKPEGCRVGVRRRVVDS